MRHLKRQSIPKEWPIQRKGNKFFIKNTSPGIPLLVVMRDLLKISRNRREVKKALVKKMVLISNRAPKNEKSNLELFDTLTLKPLKKNYRLALSDQGKYSLDEINEKDSKTKISKVRGKKILKGKKIQINLSDGRNYLSNLSCKIGDSAIVDLEKNKIERILPLKKNSEILVVGGKHAGKKGKIKNIDEKLKIAEIESEKTKLNVLIKQLVVFG